MKQEMKKPLLLATAICLCGGCFSFADRTPHASIVEAKTLADYAGTYSNRSIHDEKVGNRGLGLFRHIFFDEKSSPVDAADSVRMVADGKTLRVEALKAGEVISTNILYLGKNCTLNSDGISLKKGMESEADRNHGIPYYILSSSGKVLRIGNDGSLIIEERDSAFTLLFYVIPTHSTFLTETAFRRIEKEPRR